MDTELQKRELEMLLDNYGTIVRDNNGDGWHRITLTPYGQATLRYSSERDVEYLAMRQVKQQLFHDILYQVNIIERESGD